MAATQENEVVVRELLKHKEIDLNSVDILNAKSFIQFKLFFFFNYI